jgi:protein TonB
MSGGTQHRVDQLSADERGRVADLGDAAVVVRADDGSSSAAPPIVVTNVVPFVRPQREAGPVPDAERVSADLARRPAPRRADEGRSLFGVFLLLSLAAHGGFYFLFQRQPVPMASIGLEAISVEIVLGANMPAGLAVTPGVNEAQNAPADDPDPVPTDNQTATAEVEKAKEAKPVEDVRPARPDARVAEIKPDQPAVTVAETPPERLEPQQQVAALQAEEMPSTLQPELAVTPETPVEVSAIDPVKPEAVPPDIKPEVPPAPTREPKAKTERELRPKKDREPKAKQERPGPRTRTASTTPEGTGPRSSAASGVGPGRSQTDTNYRGLVAAHLARHKRYPEEARSRGDQGTATVSFSLDGGGRVTRVALGRGTGFASLDQEVQAMVRRASPFPSPPDGRGMSFTVPVSFRVQ